MTSKTSQGCEKGHYRNLQDETSYQDRLDSIAQSVRACLETTLRTEEVVKARLKDPSLTREQVAGLRQILRTSGKLSRSLKGAL